MQQQQQAWDVWATTAGHPQPPDLDQLLDWLAEGGCEARCECFVEPDGVCPMHNQPSWLIVLGMI